MGIINKLKHTIRDIGIGAKRSKHWNKIRDQFLEQHCQCAACGSTKNLNVHHKLPFHLHPELELDPANLITLCMDNDCHLLIGHGTNFKAYNPNVDVDVQFVSENRADLMAAIKLVAKRVKSYRLFG
jgi:hypothetical protein